MLLRRDRSLLVAFSAVLVEFLTQPQYSNRARYMAHPPSNEMGGEINVYIILHPLNRNRLANRIGAIMLIIPARETYSPHAADNPRLSVTRSSSAALQKTLRLTLPDAC